MKLRRLVSGMMALLLVCSLPLAAFAEEYDLATGSISITANEGGQFVTQENGVTNEQQTTPTVITQTITEAEPSTENTVTIKVETGAEANVTIQDVNIVISDPTGNAQNHSGEAAVTIDVADGAEANVTLDGVNINTKNTGGVSFNPETGYNDTFDGEAAVQITGNGDATIELDGDNTVQGGHKRAGVEKNTTAATETEPANGTGKLTITDENEIAGSLQSTGGRLGSGIGGGYSGSGSDITIAGSAEVTATGGMYGAGIGGGALGSGSNITITGSAEVTANGGVDAAGIGGGVFGSGSDIKITGSAEVTAKGDRSGAGIGGGAYNSGSNITITGSAEVNAQGSHFGAGIGGGEGGTGSNITITGSAEVTANGGIDAAGIGGGEGGTGSDIEISGSAEVTAQGTAGGAGIGGGAFGSGSDIEITGSAEVTAKSDISGAGIGGGHSGSGSDITVSEDAQVKAQGGSGYHSEYDTIGTGAAIGGGGNYNSINGQEVTPNTNGLNEGWIATYAPDTENMNTAAPSSLTYKGASNVAGAQPIAKKEPTCTEGGHKAGFSVDGAIVAVTIPKTGHSFTNYVPDSEATCTADATKTAQCDHAGCIVTDTVPDPGTMKEHSFTNYISNNDATYDADGTKTAKCDHCDATHTIPDPGSRLVREETVQNAAPYRVVGQDGKALAFEKQQKGGVLTITVDADFATLTGNMSGLKTLKAQGIDTVVFVTNGATSTFALADLLAQGGSTDTYALTHVGSTVTLTLGSGVDVSDILK